MPGSIRRSLFAALAGFTILICLCYTGLAVVIAYVTEDVLVERLLEREAAAIEAQAARGGGPPRPASDLVTVHTSRDTLPAVVRLAAAPGDLRAEVFTRTGQHYHLMVRELPDGAGTRRMYLLADVAPVLVVSKVVQDVGGVLIFVAMALIGLALLLAWLLARRLVRPLRLLAHEAQALRPGGTASFSARGRPDEIGILAERLETGFSALQAALRRERDFTRDVGHELRTPLTVMNNTLALASTRPLGLHELGQLQAGVDELRATTEVLFALARAEHVGLENFDLRACIEAALLRLPGAQAWDEERLALTLPERLQVQGNQHLAHLLVTNCLGNALFHGGPHTRLAIAHENGRLFIANTVDAAHAGRVQGFAHGQNLLQRAARSMGWEIAFQPGDMCYRVEILPLPAP
ncbi:two-component sensor histidine kinase [Massilia varians]|uniref:histidine kinase n=1 Tax=Massilia varians TaxID=457921 RepID=A0ABM8C461_9BURK|nr:HAMP domain-containing protein [Massilia varians]BDT57989.1 two-component sensor histidine kinase [Massilia varians]